MIGVSDYPLFASGSKKQRLGHALITLWKYDESFKAMFAEGKRFRVCAFMREA